MSSEFEVGQVVWFHVIPGVGDQIPGVVKGVTQEDDPIYPPGYVLVKANGITYGQPPWTLRMTEEQHATVAMLRQDAENRFMDGDQGALAHSTAHNPKDPAFILLLDGKTSTPIVHSDGCYICSDPEFAAMGLPLCRPCAECMKAGRGLGHIPADDTVCTECEYEDGPQDYPERGAIKQLVARGFEPPFQAVLTTVPQAEGYESTWSEKDGLKVIGLPTCVITEVRIIDSRGKRLAEAMHVNVPVMPGKTFFVGGLGEYD